MNLGSSEPVNPANNGLEKNIKTKNIQVPLTKFFKIIYPIKK